MGMVSEPTASSRVKMHAALADPVRLAIVDDLASSDRSPAELMRLLGVESNLLAHHLNVLERAGLVRRTLSSGDRRRRYVRLEHDSLASIGAPRRPVPGRALFVCTRNSARSHLAAAAWRSIAGTAAESAGTHPANRIAPGALAAARRARLDLPVVPPRSLDQLVELPPLVVTVCDQAHEELDPPDSWLHWSIPDPVPSGTKAAFDATVDDLRRRITSIIRGGTDQ